MASMRLMRAFAPGMAERGWGRIVNVTSSAAKRPSLTNAAYEEVAPLAPGHQDRVELYQLFPLLVHTVLFGGGYGGSAERAARQYAG